MNDDYLNSVRERADELRTFIDATALRLLFELDSFMEASHAERMAFGRLWKEYGLRDLESVSRCWFWYRRGKQSK